MVGGFRSISYDNKICDTLWKRSRKARQGRRGSRESVTSKSSHEFSSSAVPEFVRIAMNAWLKRQGLR